MFDFLLPTYVIVKWSDWDNDARLLCTFNSHFITNLSAADKFYFKFTAKRALCNHIKVLRSWGLDEHALDYEVVDYRELGYTSEDAKAMSKYTFG